MKILLTIVFCICSMQLFYAQEDDGVVSLALPIRNSLTFNQYTINPTFSFVREQNKYISITNKREWVQFEDAPQTYLASYAGRFRENIGIGVGLFQQNYGVMTTFGGILNFAYNIQTAAESNLTFGMNVGAYKSGINSGNVVTNFSDPSLNNIPSNFLLAVTPGINYGTMFFDFGLSVNNLVLYNFNSSELIKDDPEQSIQAHLRYTGYMDSRGFFDESKFSGLVRSEFRKDKTILSGMAMLTVPKGIWAQVGYNTLYGVSGGLGLNITTQIAIEYNFEKAIGDLTDFGPSHEITLAYKFKNKERYYYSGEDEISALIPATKKRKPATTSKKKRTQNDASRKTTDVAKVEVAEEAIKAEEAKAKAQKEENERLAEEAKAKQEQEEQARLAEEAKAKAEADEKARRDSEAKAEAQKQARIAQEAKAKADAQEKARLAAIAKAKAEEEEKARLVEEAKAQAEKVEQERLAEEARAQAEAEEQQRLAQEAKTQADAEEKARLAAEAQTKENEEPKEEPKVNPTDALGKTMVSVEESTNDSKLRQDELLNQLADVVNTKDQDLKDLKEENDLGDKGIFKEPKPFKSLSEENKKLEAIKAELDQVIASRNEEIERLESLSEERQETDTIELDEVYLYYQKALKRLKSEQVVATRARADLMSRLEKIEVATEFERKRRIKRAAYDNEEDRYLQDRAALKGIRENTPLSSVPLKAEDFDFGEERSGNIEILKNVKNVENGYYVVVAVHKDIEKRDEFLRKAVSAGQTNIDFFYDVNTSKYYIYYQKLNGIEEANEAFKTRGSRSYNGKLSVVKIEN